MLLYCNPLYQLLRVFHRNQSSHTACTCQNHPFIQCVASFRKLRNKYHNKFITSQEKVQFIYINNCEVVSNTTPTKPILALYKSGSKTCGEDKVHHRLILLRATMISSQISSNFINYPNELFLVFATNNDTFIHLINCHNWEVFEMSLEIDPTCNG